MKNRSSGFLRRAVTRSSRAFLYLRILAFCLSSLSQAVANDHYLDPPSGGPNPQTKPFTVGPPKDKAIAGGINQTDEQIINHQDAPPYLDLSKPVDLPSLLNCALELNPATKQAWRQAKAAAYSLSASKGAYWPTLTLTGGATPKYATRPDYPGHTRTVTADYVPQLQLQQLLFDFGGRNATVDAARSNLLASDLSINQTLQNVCAQVAANYYNLLLQDAILHLSDWQVDIAKTINCLTSTHPTERDKTEKAEAEKRTKEAGKTLTDDINALIKGDKSGADKIVADLKAAYSAQKNEEDKGTAAEPVHDYKVKQTKTNLEQAQFLLAAQRKIIECRCQPSTI